MTRANIRIRGFTFLLLGLSLASQVQAQATTERTLAERLREAKAVLREHYDSSNVVGMSAAIAVNGQLVWSGGFGYAKLQHRVPASASTVSRIGSVSKPVAGAAAMALRDRGLWELDAPISRYLPRYPAHNAHITMRQLMSHTAGIRHYRGQEFASNTLHADVFAPMEVFWADSLLFKPGTDYSYSTYGWTVVSAVTAPWTRTATGSRSCARK